MLCKMKVYWMKKMELCKIYKEVNLLEEDFDKVVDF